MPAPMRLGDPSSHGGMVNSTADANFMGKPVARAGDSCTCPLPGPHNCKIVEGNRTWMIMLSPARAAQCLHPACR